MTARAIADVAAIAAIAMKAEEKSKTVLEELRHSTLGWEMKCQLSEVRHNDNLHTLTTTKTVTKKLLRYTIYFLSFLYL